MYVGQQENLFVFEFFLLEFFFMNSQLNFKETRELEKVVRYIHFARKNLEDELCKCKVMKKNLFSQFWSTYLMIIEFFHFQILIQYTWMSYVFAFMFGLENFIKIKYFLSCLSWDWKYISPHNSSTTHSNWAKSSVLES